MYTYKYPRPALTVDALIIAGYPGNPHILLIQRGRDPFAGMWALPGGFADMDETLEQACSRELEEETGISVPGLKQFRVYDAVDRDPRHRTVSVVFYSFVPVILTAKGGDDASAAGWFPTDRLPSLAFDHEIIVREFLTEVDSRSRAGAE